jgi:hypothetical protein
LKKQFLNILLIVLLLIVVGTVALVWWYTAAHPKFDPSITLHYKDTNPYGAKVAFEELPHLFPDSKMKVVNTRKDLRELVDDSGTNKLMVVLCNNILADTEQTQDLVNWVHQGNYAILSARYFSSDFLGYLHCKLGNSGFALDAYPQAGPADLYDSLRISLDSSLFGPGSSWICPGRRADTYFDSVDASIVDILGYNQEGQPNFIHIRSGNGIILLQSAPLAFSNYFLLYGHGKQYLEDAMSVLPKDVDEIVWNNYPNYNNGSLMKREEEDNGSSFLSKLLNNPPLGSAFLFLLLILLVYVLLNMKRTQRIIPVIAPKQNESLDFVKTIGRLYYEKGDHRNLAIKMSQHFQEFIRTKYQQQLDLGSTDSSRRLATRSGVPEDVVRDIATQIRYVHDAPYIEEPQLQEFYQLLEIFYKNAQ